MKSAVGDQNRASPGRTNCAQRPHCWNLLRSGSANYDILLMLPFLVPLSLMFSGKSSESKSGRPKSATANKHAHSALHKQIISFQSSWTPFLIVLISLIPFLRLLPVFLLLIGLFLFFLFFVLLAPFFSCKITKTYETGLISRTRLDSSFLEHGCQLDCGEGACLLGETCLLSRGCVVAAPSHVFPLTNGDEWFRKTMARRSLRRAGKRCSVASPRALLMYSVQQPYT